MVTISNCECYVPDTNEWLEATDMSIIRSALTVSVVRGLSNVRDYVHQNRHKLIEEKRMRILDNGSSLISIDASSTMSDNATSYESLAVGRDPADDEESEDLFSDDDNDELL